MINALGSTAESILLLFLIVLLGLLIGRIKLGGVSLGVSGVFIAGLVFGHFGAELPQILQSLGLVMFITAVGMSAGPEFFAVLRKSILGALAVCLLAAFLGAAICLGAIWLLGMDAPLSIGILAGAFTNSTGYAVAKLAIGGSTSAVEAMAAGYGVLYPISLLTKVLSVQIIPKVAGVDLAAERQRIVLPAVGVRRGQGKVRLDSLGLAPFAMVVVVGVLFSVMSIPLPLVGGVTLGLTGGPLLAGLVVGALGHIGYLDLHLSPDAVLPLKNIGLVLFFSCAGVEGGRGFLQVIASAGGKILLVGGLMILLPLLAGFFLTYKVLRLPLFNSLTMVSASVTSTPSLAAIVGMAGENRLAAIYGAVYPVALLIMVLVLQMILKLSGY